MAATKTKSKAAAKPKKSNGRATYEDVLTLAEAARFLHVTESEVERLAVEQEIPGRQIGSQWRFLRSALARWLGGPTPREHLLAHAGAIQDDPNFDQMLEGIYKRRGRPMVDSGK